MNHTSGAALTNTINVIENNAVRTISTGKDEQPTDSNVVVLETPTYDHLQAKVANNGVSEGEQVGSENVNSSKTTNRDDIC